MTLCMQNLLTHLNPDWINSGLIRNSRNWKSKCNLLEIVSLSIEEAGKEAPCLRSCFSSTSTSDYDVRICCAWPCSVLCDNKL